MAIILERTTGEWLGTWAVLVETLVDDIREDEPPYAIEFTMDDGQKIVGPVTAVFGDRVNVDLGASKLTLPYDEIERVVIP